jgi:hypothetical protein
MGLIVSRDSGYADRLRAYAIIVDGKKIGEIRNGETKEFPIEAGKHSISARIDWCRTAAFDFTAKEGETPSFHVRSNLRGVKIFFAIWYALIATRKYLCLEKTVISPAKTGQ